MEKKEPKKAEVATPEIVVLSDKMKAIINEKLAQQQAINIEINTIILSTLEAKEINTEGKDVNINKDLNIEIVAQ